MNVKSVWEGVLFISDAFTSFAADNDLNEGCCVVVAVAGSHAEVVFRFVECPPVFGEKDSPRWPVDLERSADGHKVNWKGEFKGPWSQSNGG